MCLIYVRKRKSSFVFTSLISSSPSISPSSLHSLQIKNAPTCSSLRSLSAPLGALASLPAPLTNGTEPHACNYTPVQSGPLFCWKTSLPCHLLRFHMINQHIARVNKSFDFSTAHMIKINILITGIGYIPPSFSFWCVELLDIGEVAHMHNVHAHSIPSHSSPLAAQSPQGLWP